jgi:hypothetical protein
MVKKKRFILKVATVLMAYATIATTNVGSAVFIGEPKLPKS